VSVLFGDLFPGCISSAMPVQQPRGSWSRGTGDLRGSGGREKTDLGCSFRFCIIPFNRQGEDHMKRILCIVPILLLMAGMAAAQDVRFNYDKSTDFKKFKTYKWVEIKSSDKDPLVDNQIRAAIEAELATKGLTKTESDGADIYVGYQTAINTEKQVNTFSSDFGYGGGWGYYRGGGGMGSTTSSSTTSTLYIGALQIDFYDVATKKAVFRAVGTKTIDTKAKPDKRQKNLAKALTKMLKEYPPVAK
jgi:hypothetical protein